MLVNFWESLRASQADGWKALDEAAEIVDACLNSAKTGLIWRNLTTNQIAVSPQVFDIFKLKPGDVYSRTPFAEEWVHPEDRARYLAERSHAYEHRTSVLLAYRIINAAGELRYIRSRGEYLERDGQLFYRGVIRDSTDDYLSGVEADARLEMLAEALKDEPLTLVRLDEDLNLIWSMNWLASMQRFQNDGVGLHMSQIATGPEAEALAQGFRQALETGQAGSYVGPLSLVGGENTQYRIRYVPVQRADGRRELFVKAYSLTELWNSETNRQMELLAEALQGEPLILCRINEDLFYTWAYNWSGNLEEQVGGLVGKHLLEVIEGPNAPVVVDAMREAFRTGKTTTFEGYVGIVGAGNVNFRGTYVPITLPDGRQELLCKNYDLTTLVTEQAEKQLNLVTDAIKDEPVILFRLDQDLNYTWAFNWPEELRKVLGPLTSLNMRDLVVGPEALAMEKQIRYTLETGEPSEWTGIVNLADQARFRFRARYTRVEMPDGSYQIFGKSYNLSDLVNQESERQLQLLTQALADEPISFSRLDRNLNYVWIYNPKDRHADPFGSPERGTGKSLFDVAQGESAEAVAKAIRECFRTGRPTSFEGIVDMVGVGPIRFRTRFVRVTLTDGEEQVFAKSYNLSELVSQESEKQLNLLTYALRDEPISFARLDENLNYVWIYNGEIAEDSPLNSPHRNIGRNFYEITQGPTSKAIGALMEEALRTGKPTEYEGLTHIVGQPPFKIRSRYIPVTQPDGTRNIFAKIYNLSELVSQEGDKQLQLLAEALTDEPIILARTDENLRWNWVFNAGTLLGEEDAAAPLGKSVYDFFEPESAEKIAPLMQQALDTGQATSYEGIVYLKRGGSLHYRARYVPVQRPDGSRNLLIKGYNFSTLAQVQAELAASETRFRLALEEEPLTLSIQNRWGEFIWQYNEHPLFPIGPEGRFYQNMPRAQMARLLRIKRRVIDSGQPFTDHMWLHTLDRENAMYARLVYHPYRLPDGTLGVIGKKYDLTTYRLAEERERETARRLDEEREELRIALEQLQKAHAEKMLELEEARQTQLSLLPQGKPEGIPYAVHYATCEEVGGDYYDFFERPEDGHLLVAVGDATGHGLRSAMLVTVVKGYLQLLSQTQSPGGMLEYIDKAIEGLALKRLYMGLLLLEKRPRGFAYASAGMPAVLVYRQATQSVAAYTQPRLFLGTGLGHSGMEEGFIPMEPGDILVAMSDGLVETQNREGKLLGMNPVRRVIVEAAAEGAEAVMKALVALQTTWLQGLPLQDDTTLMVLSYPA